MGTLEDVEFLQRLWDLEAMPSTDSRYKDASGDIWQHRWNNHDWDDDWLFKDKRFDLIDGPADRDQLRPEGWILVEAEKIAGRPRFVAQAIGEMGGALGAACALCCRCA